MKKEKYLQVFNYLSEFSKLRSNPVRDIESSNSIYPEIIWLSDILEADIFDSFTFSRFKEESNYWLSIKRPREIKEPIFPELPEILKNWVETSTLISIEKQPSLKYKIQVKGETHQLADNPNIKVEFDKYLNNQWNEDKKLYIKDLELYEKYENQSEIYKKFFSIFNKIQHFGEEYELVIGIGLLNFKKDTDSLLICRHLLTSKVEISFNEKSFAITLQPTTESEFKIETDFIVGLDNIFSPDSIVETEQLVQKNIVELDDINPYGSNIDKILSVFSGRLHSDGSYKNITSKPDELSKKPSIYYAPALLLRKRNTRSFTALYENIKDKIEKSDDSIDIPSINGIIDLDDESTNTDYLDETIYFPKKYNDEQIQIIEQLRQNNKVLVQGPPGTGKSHTIANLICHLLANGKRILVTAYTKRALEVLKAQLPKDFQDLTVNLLSGDTSSIQDLEKSVNSINDALANTNINFCKTEIEKDEKELVSIRENIALTYNALVEVKEKHSRQLEINGNYKGLLIKIAEQLADDKFKFSWFRDYIEDLTNLNLVPEVQEYFYLRMELRNIGWDIFNTILPDKNCLPSVDELEQAYNTYSYLSEKYDLNNLRITINSKDYSALLNQLVSLSKLVSELNKNIYAYKNELIDSLSKNIHAWRDKLTSSEELINKLINLVSKDYENNIHIEYPVDKNPVVLKSDAQFFLQYFKSGKKVLPIIINPFISNDIKQRKYFIKEVKVNGNNCDTIAECESVINDINIKQILADLERIWGIADSKYQTYYEKLTCYKQHIEESKAIISTYTMIHELIRQIELASNIKIQSEHDYENIEKLIEQVKYCQAVIKLRKTKDFRDYAEQKLIHAKAHSINQLILKAIQELDYKTYSDLLDNLDSLIVESNRQEQFRILRNKIKNDFFLLVDDIEDKKIYEFDILEIKNAILYKHAVSEINKLLSSNYENELLNKLNEYESQEKELISKIASKKAWLSVLERLNKSPSMRAHLQAWVSAITKIPKTGTGKRALKFRKLAQEEMKYCKDSVPCWIMPLYKVAETVNPEQEMYDYVIIDEASQLGADAIFLKFISKNIIIVGDDKQTSPEYVGVSADIMTPYIRKYLKDIPFADYYGTEFSFFDHAKRFCKGMIVLREHFRCMPEIIEFSNKHFYAPEGKGLFPLKQYSENRLEPLKTVYCQNGYTEGSNSNIINRVEAEAIASKIASLVKDEANLERTIKKTMGVITLQGNAQASLIENSILKAIGEVEYRDRKFVCGNSASFQGDERDIIFLSLVTAANHKRDALTGRDYEKRFNVAASRAKEQAWLFHSVQLDDLANTNDLRYKLLDHYLNYRTDKPRDNEAISIPGNKNESRLPDGFRSWFEVEVYNDIISKGYRVYPNYPVLKGKYEIDLVPVLDNGVKIAVECDGDKFHGAEQHQNDVSRQKVLERCGWQFFRIRGFEYYSNKEKALEPLWKLLEKNNKIPAKKNDEKVTDKDTYEAVYTEIEEGEIYVAPQESKKAKPKKQNSQKTAQQPEFLLNITDSDELPIQPTTKISQELIEKLSTRQ